MHAGDVLRDVDFEVLVTLGRGDADKWFRVKYVNVKKYVVRPCVVFKQQHTSENYVCIPASVFLDHTSRIATGWECCFSRNKKS
jgi:hypothetical protein